MISLAHLWTLIIEPRIRSREIFSIPVFNSEALHNPWVDGASLNNMQLTNETLTTSSVSTGVPCFAYIVLTHEYGFPSWTDYSPTRSEVEPLQCVVDRCEDQ